MTILNKFCFCMDLEAGGYIIGGFAIFFHSLFLGTAFIGFIMAIVSSGVILGIVSENAGSDPMFESLLSLGAGAIIGVTLLVLLIAIGFFLIALFCILGTKNRKHNQLLGMIIFLALQTVSIIFQLFHYIFNSFTMKEYTFKGVIGWTFVTALFVYLVLVLQSLYIRFRAESTSGNVYAAQYQIAPTSPHLMTIQKS